MESTTKKEKKLLCFQNATLINKVIKDKSHVEKRTESAVVEQAILNAILPTNKLLADVVINHLYSQDGGIGQALNALFNLNSAGSNWVTEQNNYMHLVTYAFQKDSVGNRFINANSETFPKFTYHLKALMSKFKDLSAENKDNLKLKNIYSNEAKYTIYLLKELNENAQYCILGNFYSLIIKHWDVLGNWTTTFSILADLALLKENWEENSENRIELLNIINEMSESWKTNS